MYTNILTVALHLLKVVYLLLSIHKCHIKSVILHSDILKLLASLVIIPFNKCNTVQNGNLIFLSGLILNFNKLELFNNTFDLKSVIVNLR